MFQYISPDQGDNTLRLQVGSKRAVSIDFSETLYLNFARRKSARSLPRE